MNNGYIKLYRKFLEWEWLKNPNDVSLFIHLLLMANWKDSEYKGVIIPRGSLATGRKELSRKVGISEQQIRTTLEHLKLTNVITTQNCVKFTIISINNYDKYQIDNQDNNHENVKQLTTYEKINKLLSMYVSINNNVRTREKVFNQVEMDMLEMWVEQYDFSLVVEAIRLSLLKHKDNLSYTNGILVNWHQQGVKKIEDIKEYEKPIEEENEKESIIIPNVDWLNMEENEFYDINK